MDNNFMKILSNPTVIIIVLLGITLFTIMPVLTMLILGAVLAYGIRPIAAKIQTKIHSPFFSVLLSILLIVLPLILLIGYIFSVMVGVSIDVITSNSQDFSYFTLNNISLEIEKYFPPQYTNVLSEAITSLYAFLISSLGAIANYSISLAQKVPYISLQLFVLVASVYYFTKDGDKCYNFIKSLIPDNNLSFFNTLTKQVESVLVSIFYGHFLTSLIIGIIAMIVYSVLGYPYAFFLGILSGIFQLIPILGPWPIYCVLAIVDLFNGNYVRPFFVLALGIGLSLSDMYIRPTLTSKHADIHPLILLLGFLTGPFVFGIIGLILGPLIIGITYAVINSIKIENDKMA